MKERSRVPQKDTTASSSATLLHTVSNITSEHVTFQNFGTNIVYLSDNPAVTTTTGFPLTPNSQIYWRNAVGSIYGVTTNGTARVSVTANVS